MVNKNTNTVNSNTENGHQRFGHFRDRLYIGAFVRLPYKLLNHRVKPWAINRVF